MYFYFHSPVINLKKEELHCLCPCLSFFQTERPIPGPLGFFYLKVFSKLPIMKSWGSAYGIFPEKSLAANNPLPFMVDSQRLV